MKIKLFATLLLGFFAISSCIKHEIIPPPEPVVDFNCSFIATIDGSTVEYTENVDGMYCEGVQSKEILPNPQPSTATYYSEMKSNEQLDFVQIGLGKVNFQASVTPEPSLSQFSSFITSNATPAYATDADGGVQVVFRDQTGDVWTSDPASPDAQDFTFVSLTQESDASGDYMKFEAHFNCTLFNDDMSDFIVVEDAVYKAFFKR